MVSLVVAALVLSAGIGAAVLMLRGRGGGVNADPTGVDGTASTSSRWSSAWLDGFEEAWTLNAPSDHGNYVMVKIVGDKLIRAVNGGGTTTVTMFSLGRGSPIFSGRRR